MKQNKFFDVKGQNPQPPARPYYRYSRPPARPSSPVANRQEPVRADSAARPVASQKRSRPPVGIATVLILLSVLGAGGFFWMNRGSKPNDGAVAKMVTEQTNDVPEEPEKTFTLDTDRMRAEIVPLIAAHPELQVSISFVDLNSQTAQQYGVEDPFVAASVAKLVPAVMFLHKVQNKEYTMETEVGGLPAREQLRVMIENSDNASWAHFDALLGSENVVAFAQELGMKSYSKTAETQFNSQDIALLLNKLYRKEILNEQNTKILLSHMQKANQDQYIRSGIPTETSVYHKVGYLKDRVHDAAIIDNGERPYVLVIFSKSKTSYDYAAGAKFFQEIAKTVNNHYLDPAAEQ